MIKNFKDSDLEDFFENGFSKKIGKSFQAKLKRQLDKLNVAELPSDMNLPGYGLHKLSPKSQNRWAVSVNGNWRLTFEFDDNGNAVNVDFEDYH